VWFRLDSSVLAAARTAGAAAVCIMLTAPKELGIPLLKRLIFVDCLPAFQPEGNKVAELTLLKIQKTS